MTTLAQHLAPEQVAELAALRKRARRKQKRREHGRPKRLDQKRRRKIFERDSWACVECGASENLTIDHVIPLSRGGSNLQDNLQTLCWPCNIKKADS